jgi:hypothetical protein
MLTILRAVRITCARHVDREEIAFLRRSATALRQIARIERHLLTRLTDLADQLEAQAEELETGSFGRDIRDYPLAR